MSITVKFYNFAKRDNSTKQPASNAGTPFYCDLKDESGIINPTLLIHGITNPSSFNYAYIADYGRYYYVNEWRWMMGSWECSMYCDVLATYKNYIGSSTQYVVRSSAEFDGQITDELYPTVAIDESSQVDIGSIPLQGTLQTGTYVLGVINKSGGYGAVQYFALDASIFASVCDFMFATDPTWYKLSNITKVTPNDITEIALPKEVMKSLVNPMQYVVSCMFFPSSITVPVLGSGNIRFGWWDSEITGHWLGPIAFADKTVNFTIPAHPQAATRGNYLNLSPFTRVTVNAGLFGFFPLDMTYFTDSLSGSMRIGIDCITGEGTLMIRNNDDHIIGIHRAQVGVPIKLAQITRDYLQTAANVIGTAAEGISGVAGTIGKAVTGDIGGAIQTGASTAGTVASGIVSSIKSAMPTLTAGGSGGSLFDLNRAWNLTAQHFLLAEEDNANRGRPLAKKKQISTIPGYILVDDPDVETNGIGEETEMIRNYLAGGFFYE